MEEREFFAKLAKRELNGGSFTEEIAIAYNLAEHFHAGQMRADGQPYFSHLQKVACALIDHGNYLTNTQIIVALLRDSKEDCRVPCGLVTRLFGETAEWAVYILSKINNLYDLETGLVTLKTPKGATYWSSLLGAPSWVKEIKVADRLDNIKSMTGWSAEKRNKYLLETKEKVLPLALTTPSGVSNFLLEAYQKLTSRE